MRIEKKECLIAWLFECYDRVSLFFNFQFSIFNLKGVYLQIKTNK